MSETWADVWHQIHWTDLAIAGICGVLMVTAIALIIWLESRDQD